MPDFKPSVAHPAGCTCAEHSLTASDYTFDRGRRQFILDGMAAIGGLSALGLSAATPRANAATDEPLRIGYLPITDATPLLVAHALGYYQDEGLDVAQPELIRGWAPLVEAFARHRYNLVHLLNPIPVWLRYNNNFPVKVTGWAHVNGSALVVSKHLGAHGFEDLGGTQIAVPHWYSVHNTLLQMALRAAGLEPVIQDQNAHLGADQVNLLILPPPDMPPALAAERIDAYIVAEPFNAAGETLADATVLRFTGDIWKNHPCCVVCMHERDTAGRPEWSQKVMNALVRASAYAQANKAEVAHLLSRDGHGYLPMPADVVTRAMTHYEPEQYAETDAIQHPEWGTGRIDFAPYPYPSATEQLVRAMNQTRVNGNTRFLNNLDPAHVAQDLVDYRFVRHAMQRYPDAHLAGTNPDAPWAREETLIL